MKEFFADADAGLYGLLFFFAFFCVVLLWTFRPGAKKQYEDQGNIPLKETEE
ncbi:MAG: CcoQ/FixQ family Cbb3-type cytochrome c oxidase assembly chaperone [Micavibrio sp.]|nr:CcoQ/FixQ family Cbb3-type cytochrome c oxidase assembly chaperone [Micavibrio sp.]|tara:strand:+ start:434 stop:589 length:156 start_codon:yes stop_codon:yes gene_type:complete